MGRKIRYIVTRSRKQAKPLMCQAKKRPGRAAVVSTVISWLVSVVVSGCCFAGSFGNAEYGKWCDIMSQKNWPHYASHKVAKSDFNISLKMSEKGGSK
jgi:hypothetical protein